MFDAAAHAAARRARHRALARGDRGARAAAAPGQRPIGRRRSASTGCHGARSSCPAELVARAAAPLVGRSESSPSSRGCGAAARDRRAAPARATAASVVLAGGRRDRQDQPRRASSPARATRTAASCSPGARPRRRSFPTSRSSRRCATTSPTRRSTSSGQTVREYGPELARLVPELRRRAPELPPPVEAEPETERYRLFEAVVGLLEAISARAPDPARARRPPLGRPPDAAAAPPPRPRAEPGPPAGPRSPTGRRRRPATAFADALAELRRERLADDSSTSRGLSRARDGRARAGADRRRALARRSRARCTRRPRATRSSSRRSSATSPRPGVRAERRRRPRAAAGRAARGGQGDDRPAAGRLDPQTIEWLRVAAVIGRDFDADAARAGRLARRGRSS